MVHLRLLEAETKALEEIILFSWNVGVWDVIFECDSKIVCDAVTECSEPPLAISSLIEGIRQKLQDFRRAQVSHVLRQGVVGLFATMGWVASCLAMAQRFWVGESRPAWLQHTPNRLVRKLRPFC